MSTLKLKKTQTIQLAHVTLLQRAFEFSRSLTIMAGRNDATHMFQQLLLKLLLLLLLIFQL